MLWRDRHTKRYFANWYQRIFTATPLRVQTLSDDPMATTELSTFGTVSCRIRTCPPTPTCPCSLTPKVEPVTPIARPAVIVKSNRA